MNKRLLIFEEIRSPSPSSSSPSHSSHSPYQYNPVNKLGLPICFSASSSSLATDLHLPSMLDLPLRALMAFTEIFNQPKYKGWAVVAAGPYKDPTVTGTYYAVVLEQVRDPTLGLSSGSGLGQDGSIEMMR